MRLVGLLSAMAMSLSTCGEQLSCSSPSVIEAAKEIVRERVPGTQGFMALHHSYKFTLTVDAIRTTERLDGNVACAARMVFSDFTDADGKPIPPSYYDGPHTAEYKAERTDDGGVYVTLLAVQ